MICLNCKNEMLIDHTSTKTVGNEEITTYYHTCINPTCTEYRKTRSATGEEAETQIQEKKEK